MFAGSILVAGVLVVRMPADYLTRQSPPESRFLTHRPLLRTLARLVKNAFGLMILVAGLIMLLTPGQGVLFIFLGVTLLDFPGKQKMVQRLLGRPGVMDVINKLRSKAKCPPLESPNP